MKWIKDTPWWVFAICFALSSIEPITHFALQRIDNEHSVHSGLHTPDSAIYLTCMKMLDNDFFSPYATCKAPNGPNDPGFLPTPFHWLYAILGEIGRWFGIGEFMFLGIANGFFGLIYLLVVYRFLRTAVPDLANLAFLLWSLGGGLGGIVFISTLLGGFQSHEAFERGFFRFFMYELIEGPGLYPLLHIPRLYYTTSLALGFGFLSALINGLRMDCSRHVFFAGFLLFGSSLINIRFGAFAWGIAVIYLVCQPRISWYMKYSLSLRTFTAVFAAALVFGAMQYWRPQFLETAVAIVRESIWPSGLMSAALFLLPLFICACWLELPKLPRLAQVLAVGMVGHLIALAGLYVAYTGYYGNVFWGGGDQAALARVSDFALVGGIIGLLLGIIVSRPAADDPFVTGDTAIPEDCEPQYVAWFVVWALAFMMVGMSAFGQGWGVRLAPQRLLAFLGVPTAVCAAVALNHFRSRSKYGVSIYIGLIIASGLTSIFVASVYFQGSLGRSPSTATFDERHPELISPADAFLLDQLRPGVVLTPPELADAAALRPGVRVIGGIGSTDLSDYSSLELDMQYDSLEGSLDRNLSTVQLKQFCVEYVLLSDSRHATRRFDPSTHEQLEIIARAGNGYLVKLK